MHRDDLYGFNEFANGGKHPPLAPKKAGEEPHLEKYRPELSNMGLSEPQETELLLILTSIMWHFAKMGWSVDVCGLFSEEYDPTSDAKSAGGKLSSSPNKEMTSKRRLKEVE